MATRQARRAVRLPQARRSKYGVRVDKAGKLARTVDGVTFDSLAEARRYGELKLLEKAGAIIDLQLQPPFQLAVYGHAVWPDLVIGEYRADFSYLDVKTKLGVVEDVKGHATALYKWKKKHVEAQYNITIREVR